MSPSRWAHPLTGQCSGVAENVGFLIPGPSPEAHLWEGWGLLSLSQHPQCLPRVGHTGGARGGQLMKQEVEAQGKSTGPSLTARKWLSQAWDSELSIPFVKGATVHLPLGPQVFTESSSDRIMLPPK